MPEPAIRASWRELASLDALATHFDVSPSAMHWRLYSFGLLTDRPSPDEGRPASSG
jgi:Zn-dependent peptidase ImmA (M78 family)